MAQDPFGEGSGEQFTGFGEGGGKNPFADEGEKRKRIIMYSVFLLLVLGGGGAFYYYTMPTEDETASTPVLTLPNKVPAKDKEEAPAPVTATPVTASTTPSSAATDAKKPVDKTKMGENLEKDLKALQNVESELVNTASSDASSKEDAGATVPVLVSPGPGMERAYDETSGDAIFEWTGGGSHGSWISFSREPDMAPVEFKAFVKGHRYKFHRPFSGDWFWQVSSAAGNSPIQSFKIQSPVERKMSLVAPKPGDTLAKTGDTARWEGDSKVTYYKLEISNRGWGDPNYRFATSGTSLRLPEVAAGSYNMRLGAFSEVSGRWEYTSPIAVSFQ